MTLFLDDGDVQLYEGDCIQVMRGLPEASVDAVCTDPPYALAFMSRAWDTHATPLAFQEWCREWAAEAFRVLRPGGHLVAFGGTRTVHRLACGIEDAGMEIRDRLAYFHGGGDAAEPIIADELAWIYGSGRPLPEVAQPPRRTWDGVEAWL